MPTTRKSTIKEIIFSANTKFFHCFHNKIANDPDNADTIILLPMIPVTGDVTIIKWIMEVSIIARTITKAVLKCPSLGSTIVPIKIINSEFMIKLAKSGLMKAKVNIL